MLRRPRASSFETRFSHAKIQDDHVIVVNVVSILTFPRATPAGHDQQGALGMSMNQVRRLSLPKRGLRNERFGNHSGQQCLNVRSVKCPFTRQIEYCLDFRVPLYFHEHC